VLYDAALHQLPQWEQQYVRKLEAYRITYNGIFAEYVVVPGRAVHKLPDNVSFVDAACLEPISLTVRTLTQVKLWSGYRRDLRTGAIGLFHLQAFKAAGPAR